ncbi:MAG: hypothetical protein N2Z21_03225 [Candidatus Sumerlaeaceae bacterium]|nr:hypothetical protein [Candidatus Sumerlaeaceae bacterium]
MMGSVLLALIAQLGVGSGVLAFLPPHALERISRYTKVAIVLFCGLTVSGLSMLVLLCLGMPLAVEWFYALGALGATGAALFVRRFRDHWVVTCPNNSTLAANFPLTLGTIALATWVVLAALCLPSVDYDSIAIWSYRVRVLLHEGSLYCDSLRSPLRIAPMPKHPYFLPVVEALYCGRSGFSHAVTHVPHLAFYAVYVLVVLAFSREWFSCGRRLLVRAALLCMPAPAVLWWLEGAREPAIGVAAVWCVYWLIHWLHKPTFTATVLCALGLATMYHIKVEGVAIAVGMCAAFVLGVLLSATDRRERAKQAVFVIVLLIVFAVPWEISKKLMPPSQQDYDFTAGFDSGWFGRLPVVPYVLWMAFGEIFLRPELYGAAPHLAAAWLLLALRRSTWRHAVIVLLPLALCFGGILAIYVVRQEQLGPARNVTFSRRFVCFIPAAVLATAYVYEQRQRLRSTENLADGLTSPTTS